MFDVTGLWKIKCSSDKLHPNVEWSKVFNLEFLPRQLGLIGDNFKSRVTGASQIPSASKQGFVSSTLASGPHPPSGQGSCCMQQQHYGWHPRNSLGDTGSQTKLSSHMRRVLGAELCCRRRALLMRSSIWSDSSQTGLSTIWGLPLHNRLILPRSSSLYSLPSFPDMFYQTFILIHNAS
jgi:hypothetical protein